MRPVDRRIEEGSDHYNQRSDDRNGFDACAGDHLLLDAESQAGCTGLSKKGEGLEAPSGLEPEPQV